MDGQDGLDQRVIGLALEVTESQIRDVGCSRHYDILFHHLPYSYSADAGSISSTSPLTLNLNQTGMIANSEANAVR